MLPTADLETEVLDTVAAVLGLDRSRLSAATTAEQLGIDSLDLMKVTFAIERRFDVNLSSYGFREVDSMQKLIALLAERHADGKRAA
jgi:acyl carrier protein